jgi:hypothetical protein
MSIYLMYIIGYFFIGTLVWGGMAQSAYNEKPGMDGLEIVIVLALTGIIGLFWPLSIVFFIGAFIINLIKLLVR